MTESHSVVQKELLQQRKLIFWGIINYKSKGVADEGGVYRERWNHVHASLLDTSCSRSGSIRKPELMAGLELTAESH